MFLVLIGIYTALFTYLAWKNLPYSVALLIVSLPSYLIRFNIGPLPSTLLELNFGIIFLVWFIRYAANDRENIRQKVLNNKLFTIFCLLFIFFSFISIFFAVDRIGALGTWRAFFLEPFLMFLIIIGRQKQFSTSLLLWSLSLSTFPISLLAVAQKITGRFFPPSLAGQLLFGRVTSFFTSPNAVGLYLEPIFFISIYLLIQEIKKERGLKNIFLISSLIFLITTSLLAIVFTLSVGTWLGLAVGLLTLLFLFGWKKLSVAIFVLGILSALFFPPLHHTILNKSRSTTNRFILWSFSKEYLLQSPAHFVFGSGLRSFFEHVQSPNPHYNPRTLEPLTYPHNIFLNFWMETGLLGMLSFTIIYNVLFIFSYKLHKHSNKLLGAIFFSLLLAYFIHGLVDVPYFKNDLAMMFWILAGIIVSATPPFIPPLLGEGRGERLGRF